MDIQKCINQLILRGHKVSFFESHQQAVDYLVKEISGTEVGIGGCRTADEIGLYDSLSQNNTVFWHWKSKEIDVREKANSAPVYITGINALTEDGQILNIDGTGNRLAGQVYGKKKVYYICGINKICKDFDSALFRARNTAATKNASRFDLELPCKIDGKCHDCRSESRICNALLVIWGPSSGIDSEVILINEELGF